MYPNPSARKRIACSAFYEAVRNGHTPSSSDFKEFNPQGYHLRIPKNCPTARDHLFVPREHAEKWFAPFGMERDSVTNRKLEHS